MTTYYREADATEVPTDVIGISNSADKFLVHPDHVDPKRWGAYVGVKEEIAETRREMAAYALGHDAPTGSPDTLSNIVQRLAEQEVVLRMHGTALRHGKDHMLGQAARTLADTRVDRPQHPDVLKGKRRGAKNVLREELGMDFYMGGDDDATVTLPARVLAELFSALD